MFFRRLARLVTRVSGWIERTSPTDVPAAIAPAVRANNNNQERPTESRSGMAAFAAIITGLGTLLSSVAPVLTQAATLSGPQRWFYIAGAVFGTGTTSAGLYGVWGRFRANLPPMYRRWWNPISWLARRRDEVLSQPTGT